MEIKVCSVGVKFEILIFAEWGVLLIRAGEDTIIAAEEAVADFFG